LSAHAARNSLIGPGGSLDAAVARILAVQTLDGAIPWYEAGPWDAWNHAECLMALAVAGRRDAVDRGFDYLAESQETAGGWLCGYGNAVPMEDDERVARTEAPQVRDTNFAAYPATAVWHRYRLSGDLSFVRRYWGMVRSAIDFVLRCQGRRGEVSWCSEAVGTDVDDALLAGNASIFKSVGHALLLARLMDDPQPAWGHARERLRRTILSFPERFDRRADRSGFAMDWYYPILAGVVPPAAAKARLRFHRSRFIEPQRGCRCVATEPWATVAESAELALTLVGLGLNREAAHLLAWQERHRDVDGAYWMGWQFQLDVAWPLEKPSWTQAVMILAHDALNRGSAAHDVLVGP
jgi:hypothetical protein